jgi:ABC-2 type transport system permease protein
MLMALLGRSLARMRGLLIGAALIVSAFQIALVLQARAYDQQQIQALGRMVPAFVQRWLGDSLLALGSFQGIVTFGYFHPVIVLLVAFVTMFAASDPAADTESGYVDLLLSRPVARHWLVTRSAVLVVACPIALAFLMAISTWTAVALFAPPSAPGPSARTIGLLAAHLVAVAWCFGAGGLLLAAGAGRRGSAFVPAATAAIALYFVNVLAASWQPARVLDVLSPFHYYRGPEIVVGLGNPVRDLLLLGTAALVLAGLAYRRFSVRDF